MRKGEPIQIDLDAVLRSKLGKKAGWVPRFAVDWLRRTVCVDELNSLLRKYYPNTGADFCDAMVNDFGTQITMTHAERLPEPGSDARVIFVSNHPLGGFDGVVLISQFCRRYGKGVKFIVNDLLMAVEPIRDAFLPINKHGKQSRQSIESINRAMDGADPIVIFPAGLVSRRGPGGKIKDLEWHKMFVTKAIQHRRDVVPIFFSGENTPTFYKRAQWRKRLGIKFNIEMLYLPHEMLGCRGKAFEIRIGERLPWQSLQDAPASEMAQRVKEMAYAIN